MHVDKHLSKYKFFRRKKHTTHREPISLLLLLHSAVVNRDGGDMATLVAIVATGGPVVGLLFKLLIPVGMAVTWQQKVVVVATVAVDGRWWY